VTCSPDDAEAIELAKLYFSYCPARTGAISRPPTTRRSPAEPLTRHTVPERESVPFDIHDGHRRARRRDSFFEIKPLFAAELVIGFGRMAGETVGIVANNSMVKGGVLFTDSADKAARFIWLCDAFSIPLIYLADVPGFMIGSEVERGGIIRHGAKMVSAVSEATVPQFCVVVRKAYGAGLYAMGGPGFGPDATIALPTARSPSWARRRPSTRSTPTRSPRSATPDERAPSSRPSAGVRGGRRPRAAGADLVIDEVIEADRLRDDLQAIYGEFDPGSGRTLAACLTHASRTDEAPSGVLEWRTGE
jgi:acetyl-CoA carboxylase carboxyltransferase component